MILRIPMLATRTGYEYAHLTDEHATASYGRPVLVWRGEPYGPEERLSGRDWPVADDTGRTIIESYLDRDTTVDALATEEIRALLAAYLGRAVT